jgi:restriction system protein
MTRKKSDSILEDLFEIAARLPWWIGCALALIAYAALHRFATADVAPITDPAQIGKLFTTQMVKTLAVIGQYILPLIFLAGAFASFLGFRKRQGLVRGVANDRSGDALRTMSWSDFELFVGQAFRMRGYAVRETGGGGADGGVDLKLSRDNEVFLVQCKQWRAFKVSVNIVRELFGVMAAQGAAGGFVVTSGVFTDEAMAFAKGRNIELIDGTALARMIERARVASETHKTDQGVRATGLVAEMARTAGAPVSEPTCPRCGSAMVKRVARQGANAGKTFWGCITYPKCRGVQDLA